MIATSFLEQFDLKLFTIDFISRFFLNSLSVIVLIKLIYFYIHKKSNYLFTFFSFNLIIFVISFLLNRVEMSMGAAFGLFAVFSMLRYRTESLDITEMTYLFLSIAFGLLNAMIIANWYEILLIDLLILGFVIVFESKWVANHESSKKLIYDRLDLLAKTDKADLLLDLSTRTGYTVKKVEVESMDLLKDVAILVIYYKE
ncbi:MAG: DUF4956 domain-containing protein [Bacteroidetes bacterium]|nr:DUF4956 domain-containing protein [Bacteroidota bacterium]